MDEAIDVVYKARERDLFLKGENHCIRTHGSYASKLDLAMIRHTAMSAYLKRAHRISQSQD
ncbi:hypothetical protein K3495_g6748 [Podosphaera aphanis]|nr:hypothetical protein K3495_g6748 [Podosphaera aphanis]